MPRSATAEAAAERSSDTTPSVVASSNAVPWAVNVLGSPAAGPPQLPRTVDALLTIRIGEPLGRARGGWKSVVNFDVGEGYAVFKEKCFAKFTQLLESPEASTSRLTLPENSSIYLRRAKNDTQAKYIELTPDNFLRTLEYRWKLLTPNDLRQIGDFQFEAFLYVQRATQPEQFHRATARRDEQARIQRMAFEAANAVQFGAIAAHHLDIVQARRPDSAPFEVPEDNTTTQTIELDRQRELQQQQKHVGLATPDTATIYIKLNGLWMPVEIEIVSLRRALGLPDHDIFSSGIYREFTPSQPTNGAMDDEDHAEDDPMN